MIGMWIKVVYEPNPVSIDSELCLHVYVSQYDVGASDSNLECITNFPKDVYFYLGASFTSGLGSDVPFSYEIDANIQCMLDSIPLKSLISFWINQCQDLLYR